MKYKKLGVIGRFKPLHLGAAVMLDEMCINADEVVIGVGSSNKYNFRNPFTFDETKEMIEAYLNPKYHNFSVVAIDDYAHIPEHKDGKKWVEEVVARMGDIDAFVTGNPYSADLLRDRYDIIVSYEFIPKEKHVMISGTMVRNALATNHGWEKLLPVEVRDYIKKNQLDIRFRNEFGLETLANTVYTDYREKENVNAERVHTYEK
ncbi:MAG: hypothetical protein ACMXYG_07640 [Candidatus Woesearchaeota archaeon]